MLAIIWNFDILVELWNRGELIILLLRYGLESCENRIVRFLFKYIAIMSYCDTSDYSFGVLMTLMHISICSVDSVFHCYHSILVLEEQIACVDTYRLITLNSQNIWHRGHHYWAFILKALAMQHDQYLYTSLHLSCSVRIVILTLKYSYKWVESSIALQ